MKAIIAGTPTKITTMADKTLRIMFDTQELEPIVMSEIMNIYGKYGNMIFVEGENQIDEKDMEIPKGFADENRKTKSQILRAVLYRLWEKYKKTRTFEEYYNSQMELLINMLKNKLD